MLVLTLFSLADFTISTLNFAILNNIIEKVKAGNSENIVSWGRSKNLQFPFEKKKKGVLREFWCIFVLWISKSQALDPNVSIDARKTNRRVRRHRFQLPSTYRLWRNVCSALDCSGKTCGRCGNVDIYVTIPCSHRTRRQGGASALLWKRCCGGYLAPQPEI